MNIKKRILLVSVLLVVFFISLGSTVLFGYRYVTNITSTANALDNQAKFLQMMLRGVNEVIVTEGTPQSVEIVELGLKGFNDHHLKLLSEIKNTGLYDDYTDKVNAKWKNIMHEVQPFLEHHLDISVEEDEKMIQYGKLITITDKLIEEINEFSIKTRILVDSDSKTTEIIQYIMFAMLLLSTILIVYMSYIHYRSIIAPIKDLNEIAKGFEKGDLSITMNDSRQDEFGVLALHFNKAVAKLSNMISNIKTITSTISSDSKKLSDSSSQIAGNSKEQSSQTTETAAAMEELSTSFVDVAQNTSNAAESSKNASELAREGVSTVKKAINGMNKISDSVNNSASAIEALGKRNEQIGDIIKVINDIAGQTNLLALNAAIEAARAGEQGRGFSVVADEVRKLAERTTEATSEIGDMIKGIQVDSITAIESMQMATEEVGEGVNLSNQAGESLQEIVQAVNNVEDMVTQISTATDEQASTGEAIVNNIESVANLSQHTSDNAQKSSYTSQHLTGLVRQLQHLVSGFKVQNYNSDEIRNQLEIDPEQSIVQMNSSPSV